MKAWLLVLALLSATQRTEADAVVFGYLPEWRYEGLNYAAAFEVVTHLIFFSVEVSPLGHVVARERLPRAELLDSAKQAAQASGGALLLCVGGNGRSAGFAQMVAVKARRTTFIAQLLDIVDQLGLHGIDLNWEYPGYQFGIGYVESEVDKDYRGLGRLLNELSSALHATGRLLTLAYYPDGRQERLLAGIGAHVAADYLHSMAYDQPGQHATLALARQTVDNALALFPPAAHGKVTLGLPFYGRAMTGAGDWRSYEDIVAAYPEQWRGDQAGNYYWNGVATVAEKTALALSSGLAGVMIWELGQDCRTAAVQRSDGTAHPVTCPLGDQQSLLVAVGRALDQPGPDATELFT